jgi:antitoxin component YwqK of YwqJK toxin-antitoxin module
MNLENRTSMDYYHGRLHGVMTMYGIDGKVLKTITYEDGSVKKLPPPDRK